MRVVSAVAAVALGIAVAAGSVVVGGSYLTGEKVVDDLLVYIGLKAPEEAAPPTPSAPAAQPAAPQDAAPAADRELPAPPARELAWTAWSEEEAPDYWRVIGPAVVDVEIPAGRIAYSPLDSLGRAGRAAGTIDYATMAAGIARERTDISNLKPSGWGRNAQTEIELPENRVYRGYFWNRSHLIAKSLGGADELENLVCGTRTQNVGANDGQGGMAWCENLVRSWLEDHPAGTVFYSSQPVYEGDEPVCRSVIVDIRSSDGELDLEVEVYNAAKGHEIDYASGGFTTAVQDAAA